jgi:hypothetical protein
MEADASKLDGRSTNEGTTNAFVAPMTNRHANREIHTVETMVARIE